MPTGKAKGSEEEEEEEDDDDMWDAACPMMIEREREREKGCGESLRTGIERESADGIERESLRTGGRARVCERDESSESLGRG